MSFSSRATVLACAVLILAAAGCACRGKRKAPAETAGAARVAIVPMDDQGPHAAETWPSLVLPVAIARQFANQDGIVVRGADSVASALHSGATHLVHARLTGRAGGTELVIDIETVAGRRIARAGAAKAGEGSWLGAAVEAARLIKAGTAPQALPLAPPGVTGEAAMKRLGLALSTAVDAEDALVEVARSYPDCGWCWEASVERLIKTGNRDAVLALLRESRAARGVDEISRTRLDLAEAGVARDAALRSSALSKLAGLTPSSVEVFSELAADATRAKRFGEAAQAWKRVLAIDPSSFDAMNQLGYIDAWQGRFDEGLRWLKAYEDADPASANASDSMGEVLMMAGRFEEAERAFVSSFQKSPGFNGGAAMEKSALACWLRGDEAGMGRRLDEFLKHREVLGDSIAGWRRARWLYLTGRTDEARQLLDALRVQGTPPAKAFAIASRALWAAEDGDREEAEARLAELASLEYPGAARLVSIVASVVKPQSGSGSALYAGIRHLLAGNDAQAIVALKSALASAGPGEDWLPRELLAAACVRTGDVASAAGLLRAGWPIPASAEGQLTDFLVYPDLLYVRAKVAARSKGAGSAAALFESYLKSMGGRPDHRRQKDEARKAVRL